MNIRGILPIVALGLVSSFANAATIDFGIEAPTTGSITYAGGASILVGTNIDVNSIVGLGTPANSDTPVICDNCRLSFNSGAHTSGWDFGAGGTISIVGGVSAAGIAPNTTLLSGTFDSATVFDIGGGLLNFKILGAGFTDTKDPDLLSYFGMPTVDYVGGLNISFSTIRSPSVGSSFTSDTIFSGNVINNPVPVPAAVWLFGSGLIGLVGIARQKKKA